MQHSYMHVDVAQKREGLLVEISVEVEFYCNGIERALLDCVLKSQ